MAHDTHFLERIERLNVPEAEAALELYREPRLIQFLLGELEIPDGAERIALELRRGEAAMQGPWIVVARDGGFVTVLGQGMAPRGLHVVTHTEWARLQRRHGKLGDIFARAGDALSDRDGLRRVLRRMYAHAQYWSREHFREARAVAPLMLPELMMAFAEQHHAARSLEHNLTRMALRHQRSGRAKMNDALGRDFGQLWQSVWAMSHLDILISDSDAALSTITGKPGLLETVMNREEAEGLQSLMRSYTRWGPMGVLFRGAWVAARRASTLLPWLKEQLRNLDDYPYAIVGYGMGLVAIAHRHKRYAAEARKALTARSPDLPGDEIQRRMQEQGKDAASSAVALHAVRSLAEVEFEHAELIRKLLVQHYGKLVAVMSKSGREGEALPEPTDADLVSMLATEAVTARDVEALSTNSWGLSVAAPAEAECLFPTTKQAEDALARHNPTHGYFMLLARESLCSSSRARPIRRAEARVGRNDPCPCGSGKKHKRCCGGT